MGRTSSMACPVPALAIAFALMAWTSAAAADPPKEAQRVSVSVLVAHGTPGKGKVDAKCESLRKQLGPMQFGSLHTVTERRLKLRMGEQGAVVLPTGADLRIVPLSIIRQRLNLRVEVPGVVNTRLQMTSGRPVIVGGPRHKGGHLVVQIIPEY
jgi:hypothetical protein